jgi:putative FmdB family regulatory protein
MRRFRNSCFQEITEMPIYEYRCQSCGHEFEAIQKLSEAPLTTCPACSQESLRKKVSAAGFRLKGGGWYETDFKAGQKKNVAADGAGSDAGGTDAGGKGGSGKDSSGSDGAGKPAAAEGGSTSKTNAGGAAAAAATAAPSGTKSSD